MIFMKEICICNLFNVGTMILILRWISNVLRCKVWRIGQQLRSLQRDSSFAYLTCSRCRVLRVGREEAECGWITISPPNVRCTSVLQIKRPRGNFKGSSWLMLTHSCSTPRKITARTHESTSIGSQWDRSHLSWNFSTLFTLRRAQTLDKICAKLKWHWSDDDEVNVSLSSSTSKSRFGTRVQRGVHLLDKMLVATASMVGRNERIWQRIESGKLLILSILFFWAIASSNSELWSYGWGTSFVRFIVNYYLWHTVFEWVWSWLMRCLLNARFGGSTWGFYKSRIIQTKCSRYQPHIFFFFVGITLSSSLFQL